MNNIVRKLTSRKLWVAVAGIVTGIAVVLGADGNAISSVAGAVTSLVSAVAYIFVEGKIDAENVKNVIQGVQDTIEAVDGE